MKLSPKHLGRDICLNFTCAVPIAALAMLAVAPGNCMAGDLSLSDLLVKEDPPADVRSRRAELARTAPEPPNEDLNVSVPGEISENKKEFADAGLDIEELEKKYAGMSAAMRLEQADMHYNMGWIYTRQGRYEAALREYLKALAYNPRDAGVHYNLGILYEDDLKNADRAKYHYRKFLEMSPEGPAAATVVEWLSSLQ
ncbi:MAG: tetratricopeptide repeat protein [Kiritimatiellia bacterium]